MASISQKVKLSISLSFTVSESEARVLDALAGYGDDAFIQSFYDKLGSGYMKEHEHGLRLFLQSMRKIMPGELSKIDRARKDIGS